MGLSKLVAKLRLFKISGSEMGRGLPSSRVYPTLKYRTSRVDNGEEKNHEVFAVLLVDSLIFLCDLLGHSHISI